MQDYDKIRWFHSIDLGNGVITKGLKSAEQLETEFNALNLNANNLQGQRLLDIGCADGYFSLQCARLGAEVTAIDGMYHDALKYVRRHATPKFRFYCIDFLSPSFLELGRYDIILSLGVLYHTMYPFEQLQQLALASTRGSIVLLETEFYNLAGHEQNSTIYYDFEQKLTPDYTSPVFPSVSWIMKAMKGLGFVDIAVLNRHNRRDDHQGRILLRAAYSGIENSPFLYAAEQAGL